MRADTLRLQREITSSEERPATVDTFAANGTRVNVGTLPMAKPGNPVPDGRNRDQKSALRARPGHELTIMGADRGCRTSDGSPAAVREREATPRRRADAPVRLAEEREGADDRCRREHGTFFEGMRERQAAEAVADVGELVFRPLTRLGFQPWRPDVTTHGFQRLAAEAKGPVVPFHYLRHACVSWLLAAGMDVVAVSERLGHWSPSLTLLVYAHAIKGRQRELARAIGAASSRGAILT
jgi:Phage integrase family